MTARDQHEARVADAYRAHQLIQAQTEAFVASGLVQPSPTPMTASQVQQNWNDGFARALDAISPSLNAAQDELLKPFVSATEAFLSDLKAIHAVSPVQAVADLAHDERTEGFSKRPFRTNPHE